MAYNLTDVIKSGKSDWEKMQQKKLPKQELVNEAQDFGNSAVPSNVSADSPTEDGRFTTRDEYIATTGANIQQLGNTPEYQEYRKKNDVIISSAEKQLIKSVLKAANLAKDKNIPLSTQIDETLQEFEIDKKDIVAHVNESIELFNDRTRFALDRMGIGLSATNREIPKIGSLNDFKNARMTLATHLITKLMGNAPKLEEAREKTNVPDINQGSDAKKKTTIERFYIWLQSHPEDMKLLQTYLSHILTGIKKLEVFENIIEGFQKISKFSKLGRKGAQAANAIKFKGLIPQDIKEIEVDLNSQLPALLPAEEPQQVDEVMQPRTANGPGKIGFDDTMPINEEKVIDHKSKKLEKINEGWKKYLEKKTPNVQKPDDFTLLMG